MSFFHSSTSAFRARSEKEAPNKYGTSIYPRKEKGDFISVELTNKGRKSSLSGGKKKYKQRCTLLDGRASDPQTSKARRENSHHYVESFRKDPNKTLNH